MPLPFPSMNFTPLDPLTAQELNDLVANIEAVQDGSAFDAGSIDGDILASDSVLEDSQVIKSSYSTSEVNTGAKWIDGKDIYKKTVNFGALANATTKNVSHGITNIDRLIDATSNFVSTLTGELLPASYNSATGSTARIGFGVDKTSIKTHSSFDATAYEGYVTIYYTKT